MDEVQLGRLNDVYAKWENRAPDVANGTSRDVAPSSERNPAWKERFAAAAPDRPKRSATKTKSKRKQNALVRNDPFPPITYRVRIPLVTSDTIARAKFSGLCCERCTPLSRNQSCDYEGGYENILQIYLSYDSKFFPCISFCYGRQVPRKHPILNEAVLKATRIEEAVEKEAEENLETIDQIKKRAKKLIDGMASSTSGAIIRLAGFVLFKLFNSVTAGIQVHRGQMEMIKAAADSNVPVVFLPVHRSHFDYSILTFVLFCHNIKPPHIASGDNLQLRGISSILRRLGAFFIRRKLANESGETDKLYKAILQEYMTELLQKNEHMEFYLEGGRSRTGKVLPAKCGLLSMVVNAVASGDVTDVLLVPVSISYDKIPDMGLTSERLGVEKTKESLFSALRGTWSVLRGSFGEIRVNFAQPFSLEEYLDNQRGYFDLDEEGVPRETVFSLGTHVLYTADHSSAIMSPCLVAFLLANKYREGVLVEELRSSFVWLCGELDKRDRPLGFDGPREKAFAHGLSILKPFLDDSENDTIRPRKDVSSLLELTYYSNQVISVFLIDAVIAASIHSLCFSWLVTEALMDSSSAKFLFQTKLLDTAEELCSIFRNEFVFNLPCTMQRTVLADSLERLVSSGILTCTQTSGGSNNWGLDDGEECFAETSYKLVASKENLSYLSFLHGTIGSLVESYWSMACCLPHLIAEPMKEKDFLRYVQTFISKRVEESHCSYAESISLDSLRNSLKYFMQEGVIEMSEVSPTYVVLARPKSPVKFVQNFGSFKATWL
ncbi:glycerol-3-phosphate acyltransferase 1, mitochondrial-like [Oscarella lobularis]|uniref:glycerol-3-phosphate acyltransferase 1, mitochondrial-like n=1 Tax=Oscarella lobularis TaxID=121494 RepID=UPI003313D058